MAPVTPPAWLQAGTFVARTDRQMLAALLTPADGIGPLAVRSGVKPSPGSARFKVSPRPTPDLWVRVGAGSCYIQGVSAVSGAYICANDAEYDVPVQPAHATLPRKDLVYARVRDAAEDTGADNDFMIDILAGTPASAPTRPALPSQAIPLAEVTVAAGATSITVGDITDLRSYVTALGGTLPVATAADLPADPYPGMRVYRLGMSPPVEQVWDGTAWRTLLDTGYGAVFGTLAYGAWDADPDFLTTSTGGESVKYNSSSVARMTFTVPAGLPASRVIRVTTTMNCSIATGGRLWAAPLLDGADMIRERRVGIPSDGFGRGWTMASPVPATDIAPGNHTVEQRVRVDSSGAGAAIYSFEMHVELV